MLVRFVLGRWGVARGRRRSRFGLAVLLVGVVAVASGVAPGVAGAGGAVPEIVVLSNRADLVSGGDALVEVKLPEGVDAGGVRVTLDGRDITHEFAVRPNGRFQGLVSGLRPGENEVAAWVSNSSGAKLTVTNYSKQGPIFAGKQVQPWICGTHLVGLGPATGPACVAPLRYDYFYKSTATNQFETYDPASPPADAVVKKTTTDQGKTVPYIVRRERGVIDRGIYDIAVLYEPGKEWEPWAPQPAWNGKVHWLFNGGGSPSHRQVTPGSAAGNGGTLNVLSDFVLDDLPLARGFAVGTSTLLVSYNNINDVVAAEALMMTREHFIDSYGPIRYSTGSGLSGGSAWPRLIAANYPGLLDGLVVGRSIPDVWSVINANHFDCTLLGRYFNQTSPQLWTDPTARSAVHGMGGAACEEHMALGHGINFDPTWGCTTDSVDHLSGKEEPGWVYDPQTNPTGVRCTVQDYAGQVLGYRASDGFANRPTDGEGVQYGLRALVRGEITPEQFVDLNVKVGGHDIDFKWSPGRTQADLAGLRNAYRSGRIPDYRQLATIPMMDLRDGSDAEVHQSIHTKMVKARLIAANGHANNLVSWESLSAWWNTDPVMYREGFITLDRWLAAIERDTSSDSLEAKVVRNKPIEAQDTCWVNAKPGACGDGLPDHSDPRLVSGGPLTNDVLKCQRKPIDWTDYGTVQFTDAQKSQLKAAFRDGVCDWSKPGVEQQLPNGTWQSFATTHGGSPLPAPPHSVAFAGNP